MEGDGPFATLTALWHISSSQEQRLRRCRFAGEPYDDESSSGGTPVASTGIVMISLPDTPPEESTHASSQQGESVAADRHKNGTVVADEEILVTDAVDLGRDTDLGWSLLEESTERNQSALGVDSASASQPKEVIDSEPMKAAILKRKLASGKGDSPSKKSKNFPSECDPRVEAVRILELIAKSVEKFKSPSKKREFLDVITSLGTPRGSSGIEAQKALERFVKSPRKFSKILDKDLASRGPLGSNSGKSVETPNSGGTGFRNGGSRSYEVEEMLAEVNDGNREFHEATRKQKFPVEVLEPDTRENNCGLQINDDRLEGLSHEKEVIEANKSSYRLERHSAPKSIDEIDKFRYTGPSCLNPHERSNNVHGKRRLPPSLGAKGNAGGGERRLPPPSVFDVLKMLAEKSPRDPNLENLSLLEAAKRRGMTFP